LILEIIWIAFAGTVLQPCRSLDEDNSMIFFGSRFSQQQWLLGLGVVRWFLLSPKTGTERKPHPLQPWSFEFGKT